MKNTKTTLAGIGAILVAIGGTLKPLFDGDPSTSVDLTATLAAISAGTGLIIEQAAEHKQQKAGFARL